LSSSDLGSQGGSPSFLLPTYPLLGSRVQVHPCTFKTFFKVKKGYPTNILSEKTVILLGKRNF